MAVRTTDHSSCLALRRWWERAWAYTWASQNTNRVATVSVSGLPWEGLLAVPAITAMAAMMP